MLCLFCCMNGNGIGRVRFQEDFFTISEKFDSFCTLSFCCSEKSVSPNTTKKRVVFQKTVISRMLQVHTDLSRQVTKHCPSFCVFRGIWI